MFPFQTSRIFAMVSTVGLPKEYSHSRSKLSEEGRRRIGDQMALMGRCSAIRVPYISKGWSKTAGLCAGGTERLALRAGSTERLGVRAGSTERLGVHAGSTERLALRAGGTERLGVRAGGTERLGRKKIAYKQHKSESCLTS